MNSRRVVAALQTDIEARPNDRIIAQAPTERGTGPLHGRRELSRLRTRRRGYSSLHHFASVFRTLTLLICAQLRRESETVEFPGGRNSVRLCEA